MQAQTHSRHEQRSREPVAARADLKHLLYDIVPFFPDKGTDANLLLFTCPDVRLLITSFIGVQCSTLVKFGIREHWTFQDRRGGGWLVARFAPFNASSVLSPGIVIATTNVLTPVLHSNPHLARLSARDSVSP